MKKRSVFFFLAAVFLLACAGFGALLVLVLLLPSVGEDISFTSRPVVIVALEGGIYESEDLLKELDKNAEDDEVKAVVLRIDSPGGAVAPSQEIFSQVLKLRAKGKKVIASMGTVAASGGYYIASATDKIVASPGTITGSIGVIMQGFGLKEAVETLKIEPRVIKSGRMKDAGSPFKEEDPEETKFLQELSDDLYSQFLRDVSEQRKIPLDELRPIAEGKVYSGSQAKELKLVDELGNLYDALALARKEAGLPEDAKVRWPKKPTPFEEFLAEEVWNGVLKNTISKWNAPSLPLWRLDGF